MIPDPWSLDVTPDGKQLWVGTTGEFLYEVDIASLQVIARVPLPRPLKGGPPFEAQWARAIVTTANGSF